MCAAIDWLPATCAYRLRAAGEPLPRLALSGVAAIARRCIAPASRCAAGRSARTMPAIWNIIWSTASCERSDDRGRPQRARADDAAVASIRAAGAVAADAAARARRCSTALAWAEEQARVDRRAARALPEARPFAPGAVIPFDDDDADDRLARGTARARSRATATGCSSRRPARDGCRAASSAGCKREALRPAERRDRRIRRAAGRRRHARRRSAIRAGAGAAARRRARSATAGG